MKTRKMSKAQFLSRIGDLIGDSISNLIDEHEVEIAEGAIDALHFEEIGTGAPKVKISKANTTAILKEATPYVRAALVPIIRKIMDD
jgi:hypothetical protein